MRTTPGLKTGALLLVLAVHLWLGWVLANYRPDGKLAHVRSREPLRQDEVLLVLNFETRVAPAAASGTSSPSRRRRLQAALDAPDTGLVLGDGTASAPTGIDPAKPLDLHPAPAPRAKFESHDPLRHGAPALAFEATRYDKAWISNGNLTHVVARRSQIAGVILGVLGALREPCTEEMRRQYDRDCVSDQYEYKPSDD